MAPQLCMAAAILLVSVYVPFLLTFGILLAQPEADGDWRVLCTLIAVILSDTGGYAAGVFFGKHSMAPQISPKKSWEGFAGSVTAAFPRAHVGGAISVSSRYAVGTANRIESSRSISPPWPGSSWLMSLILRSRLSIDSARSPITATTEMTAPNSRPQ